ncbi:endoplasmin, putative [Plasmodium knowlesi strain H]|uniref:Endoplasmin, putative n=3 Tax=Plasmodium knowlesi TaxID=5850 RepID=A0A5K1VFA6_PLAKH|nr:endoplasmin, putative [Plasmodium knowlesi strain H]OTN63930.1 putative Endoplasmin-like protein [Plasmodium knowlesi]CAA9991009.1 endoplasmin, putative [Plasmodium knowlesi strain H]SBO20723.1 endoplasmin, putative [Plasmodium knowlesi strain H]SBO21167.1 endoplasmin, putative [Plasmodium knowlesi strain H]VVS80483.1 endoplasmin, putative [Plasmodium knowlesi strain H]|eukprot:XP_002262292.1 endoplasmin homolog, putative [Plasmodium knowlesi strain H]
MKLNRVFLCAVFICALVPNWVPQSCNVLCESNEGKVEEKESKEEPKKDADNIPEISDSEKPTSGIEQHQYQTEVTRMMDIIVNSLYTQKEVFLRELISNAADALEKIRFLSLSDENVLGEEKKLEIRISANKEKNILSITDTGIGMTKEDLINNLGTIAKSGTSNFLEAISKSGGDMSLIGQFGVGFYSAFLVADKVIVYTKNNNDEQYIWESTADAKFTIYKDPRGSTLKRGTRISLHLKEDATNLMNDKKLVDLISKYSQFIQYPIYLLHENVYTEEVLADIAKEMENDPNYDSVKVEETDDPNKKTRTVEKKVKKWKLMNEQKPIWLRPPKELTDADYKKFFSVLSGFNDEPLYHIHFFAEGEIEFKCLIYIPSRAPSINDHLFTKQNSIKLYVRRVLVADEFVEFLPRYMSFVKGVVDSDDLPLNVSREQLQQNKILKAVSKRIVRKILDTFRTLYLNGKKNKEELRAELAKETDEEKKKDIQKKINEPSTYKLIYKEYRKYLKTGCYEDDINRNKIVKLLLFKTMLHPKSISLDTYIENMKPDQKFIYYASGESYEYLSKIPQLQIFKKKNIDVVFLTESVDESCVQRVQEYDGKKFKSIQKGEITFDLTEDEKKKEEKVKKMYKALIDVISDTLRNQIFKVEISRRLVDAPCAVVSTEWGLSGQMEKLMKINVNNSDQIRAMSGQKILEINPDHPIMIDLLKRSVSNPKDSQLTESIKIIYQSAKLASGFDLEDTADLAQIVYDHINQKLGVDNNLKIDDLDPAIFETKKLEQEDSGDGQKFHEEINIDDEIQKQDSATESSSKNDEL